MDVCEKEGEALSPKPETCSVCEAIVELCEMEDGGSEGVLELRNMFCLVGWQGRGHFYYMLFVCFSGEIREHEEKTCSPSSCG